MHIINNTNCTEQARFILIIKSMLFIQCVCLVTNHLLPSWVSFLSLTISIISFQEILLTIIYLAISSLVRPEIHISQLCIKWWGKTCTGDDKRLYRGACTVCKALLWLKYTCFCTRSQVLREKIRGINWFKNKLNVFNELVLHVILITYVLT